MSILGIENRTENWKTVEHFHGLSYDAKVCLVKRLLGREEVELDDIEIELFWYGMRDWVYEQHRGISVLTDKWLEECYNEQFSSLRGELEAYIERAGQSQTFNRLKDQNYIASKDTVKSLRNNLINTEVDIVVSTQNYLFIGEAKLESTFGADSRFILVHQLIRQYVMASMLLDKLNLTENKRVIPFIVGRNAERIREHHQVKFMLDRHWLRKENVLSWKDIGKIARGCQ